MAAGPANSDGGIADSLFGVALAQTTGADGSAGVQGLADNASPMITSPSGGFQAQPIGVHGLAENAQITDGFVGAKYVSTGAGEGHVGGPGNPNAAGS